MNINILGNKRSVLNQYLAEIRDLQIQKDPLRFRENMCRIGEIFAYEISKSLDFEEEEVTTPLGITRVPQLKSQPVLATILRAGLSVHNGMLKIFDRGENCFISAYRKYIDGGKFEIEFEYMASPSLNNKVVILSDPMLASGKSMEVGYQALFSEGTPLYIHLVSVIASEQGVAYIKECIKAENVTLWLGAVDEGMNAKSYIVPGLGDAGDLAYGEKIDTK